MASVSARDPASIQIPTVAVCRKGEYSVATERPFDRVVVCVGRMREFAGVASARVTRGVSGVERGRRMEDTAFRVRADGMRSLEADIMRLVHVPKGGERAAAQRQLDAAGALSTTERIVSMSTVRGTRCRRGMAMEMRRMADDEQTSESDVVHSTLKKSLMAVLDQLVAILTAALLRNDFRQSQRPGTVRTRNRSIAPRGCLPPRNQRFGPISTD